MLWCLFASVLHVNTVLHLQALEDANLRRFLQRHPIHSDPRVCKKNGTLEGIWRYNPGEKAGINDRISIIQRLLDLAALTCSRLMFPIPCKSLTEQHNANGDYGQSLSCDHLWRHYFYLSHPWLLIESNRTEPSASLRTDPSSTRGGNSFCNAPACC